jgi:hypothetical protein
MNSGSTAPGSAATAAAQEHLPLDFLVVGAQKCATSWLHLCLAEHPQIRLPLRKREKTYIGGPWFRENGPAAFMECFGPDPDGGQRTGHVSVDYMYDPAALEAVGRYIGRPKIIASLREPVDRMISGYYWLYRKGKFEGGSDASDVLASLVGPDGRFREGLSAEQSELIRRGFYAEQLKPIIEWVGAENVLIVGYREIRAAPLAALDRIYRFLGVEPGFVPASLEVRPKLNAQRPLLHKIERALAGFPPALRVLDLLNQRLAKRDGANASSSTIRPDVREKLVQAYAPAEAALAALLSELPAASRPAAY